MTTQEPQAGPDTACRRSPAGSQLLGLVRMLHPGVVEAVSSGAACPAPPLSGCLGAFCALVTFPLPMTNSAALHSLPEQKHLVHTSNIMDTKQSTQEPSPVNTEASWGNSQGLRRLTGTCPRRQSGEYRGQRPAVGMGAGEGKGRREGGD